MLVKPFGLLSSLDVKPIGSFYALNISIPCTGCRVDPASLVIQVWIRVGIQVGVMAGLVERLQAEAYSKPVQ
jgi:hypothetical protein